MTTAAAVAQPTSAEIDAFVAAAGTGNLGALKVFLDHYPAFIDMPDAEGRPALCRAIARKEGKTAQYLIAAGAGVEVADKDGWTPLHHAACTRAADVTELLIGKGAKASPRSGKGVTPLMVASEFGAALVGKLLLAEGAAIDESDFNGNSVTSLADHPDMKKLIEEWPGMMSRRAEILADFRQQQAAVTSLEKISTAGIRRNPFNKRGM